MYQEKWPILKVLLVTRENPLATQVLISSCHALGNRQYTFPVDITHFQNSSRHMRKVKLHARVKRNGCVSQVKWLCVSSGMGVCVK